MNPKASKPDDELRRLKADAVLAPNKPLTRLAIYKWLDQHDIHIHSDEVVKLDNLIQAIQADRQSHIVSSPEMVPPTVAVNAQSVTPRNLLDDDGLTMEIVAILNDDDTHISSKSAAIKVLMADREAQLKEQLLDEVLQATYDLKDVYDKSDNARGAVTQARVNYQSQLRAALTAMRKGETNV